MFRVRQYLKMFLQNILLPLVYCCFRHCPVKKGKVLFADAHHDEIPFSMKRMYQYMKEEEAEGRCQVTDFVRDTGTMPAGEMIRFLFQFMREYATAEYVFICDYFLPAASCKKREETTLVQLWHSCGLMKKIAWDAGQDIPKHYKGNMFGNYSLLTLSAPVCVPVHARALHLDPEHIAATGVSRTDYYFDSSWLEGCRTRFYEQYPQAKGKKIVLWAPTFRGNAASPRLEGLEEIRRAETLLGEDWYVIIKAHPHIDAHGMVSNCRIPSEELLPVTDVLVTDYSSILFDYLLFGRPAVLFAPDLGSYETARGFYLEYGAIPFAHTSDAEELADAVRGGSQWQREHRDAIRAFTETYVGSCDGASTGRILEKIGWKDGARR